MTRSGVSGPPCPECESTRTKCLETGYTDQGIRLRRRKCQDCEYPSFSTIEVPVHWPFTKLDRETAFKKLMWYRAKHGAKPKPRYHKPKKISLEVTVKARQILG